MVQQDYLKTKDQLGRPDSTGLFVKKLSNPVKIEDRPLIVHKDVLADSQRRGLSTWNGTYWYATAATSANIVRVINRNNTHYERFLNNHLEDTVNTTGTWDTTNQRLVLADTEIGQNLAFFNNVTNISNATITVTGAVDNAVLYLSSDGTNFEEVSNNTKHGFTNVGQLGKWKIVASGGTVTANRIVISYNT